MISKNGIVSALSGQKTIKVEVNEYRTHMKYKKRFRVTHRFLVHCEDMSSIKVGDKVEIKQSKPISKRKAWILVPLNK